MPKTTKPKQETKAYKVSVKLGDTFYTAQADDVTEALLALNPPKISSRAFFTLEHAGKTSTLLKNVFFARRILKNKMNAFYFGRNLLTLLK